MRYVLLPISPATPTFAGPTTALARRIHYGRCFACSTLSPPLLQVGWLKADTKAIQAVGDSVITHNPRVSVSHEKLQMHKLHITDVQLDDEGVYMCQLNTDPMKSQVRGARSLAREARARSFIWRAPRR